MTSSIWSGASIVVELGRGSLAASGGRGPAPEAFATGERKERLDLRGRRLVPSATAFRGRDRRPALSLEIGPVAMEFGTVFVWSVAFLSLRADTVRNRKPRYSNPARGNPSATTRWP
jgi:hypothetical protein